MVLGTLLYTCSANFYSTTIFTQWLTLYSEINKLLSIIATFTGYFNRVPRQINGGSLRNNNNNNEGYRKVNCIIWTPH